MTDKPKHPTLTAEAFEAMLEKSALFQQLRDEMAYKASVAAVSISAERICKVEGLNEKILANIAELEAFLNEGQAVSIEVNEAKIHDLDPHSLRITP